MEIRFKSFIIQLFSFTVVFLVLSSCGKSENQKKYSFDAIPDRIWIGEDFWTVPLEDWRLNNGRIECVSKIKNATFSVLPYILSGSDGDFEIACDMGLEYETGSPVVAGLNIGSEAFEDEDFRAAIYFGKGLKLGINTSGFMFLGDEKANLPGDFNFKSFQLKITGKTLNGSSSLTLYLLDDNRAAVAQLTHQTGNPLKGLIQVQVNMNAPSENLNLVWLDNIELNGPGLAFKPENSFGPVLWTMYTLSNNTLKLSAQLPPLGSKDNKKVELQVLRKGKWETMSEGSIEPDSRQFTFKLNDWNPTVATDYRVSHQYINSVGESDVCYYEGTIQADPTDRPLRMGALTCQFFSGFPYSPLVKSLSESKPDILYFSGDQIYEMNGGYFVRRHPEDIAMLSYLGKWFMFGWAFGDLMRNVPTITTPDDHDVFHGNLWGSGGKPFKDSDMIKTTDRINTSENSGFVQTVNFVNMVNKTQCGHLPDPYDPTPIEQGMSVWYTSLNYGRVSFAIVSDRVFKSAPEEVSTWEGRKDHIIEPLSNPALIEKPELEFLGDRQEQFLSDWIYDWKNVDMKVLLSQTVFANPATHHGFFNDYLFGDMDSGGWPKLARDRTLKVLRKAFVFQISGDQHLSSVLQYGIDEYRDAGWCFCTPAISITYSRWFRPDDVNIPALDRPEHGLPNTGKYKDSFGNLNYIYAVGNPGDFTKGKNRYTYEQDKSAGFGMIEFNKVSRDIKMESWRFIADVYNPGLNDQHPGWPFTINQLDNYGRKASGWLPNITIEGKANPVLEVINESTNQTEYILRISGNSFKPWVFSNTKHTIKIGYPEKGLWKSLNGIKPETDDSGKTLNLKLN